MLTLVNNSLQQFMKLDTGCSARRYTGKYSYREQVGKPV